MIDFRVWDKKKSEILDVMDIDFSGNKVGVCNIPKRMFKDGRLHTIHSIERDWSEVEIMQSTGLKDKNGVEIYEGDILYVEQQSRGTINQFIPHKRSVAVRYEAKDTAYVFDEEHGQAIGLYTILDELEVIGNIYENPELLEEI